MTARLDFIYIGTPKAGSTWMFEALRHHPDVQLFPSKASKFFETDEPGPIADYEAQLASFEGTGKIGEISHDAYLYPHNAELLRQHFPDVKIIICLREPGDFARSLVLWLRAHTRDYGDTAQQMMDHPKLRSWMNYAEGLAPFFEAFPREQIKVLFFEDFKADPAQFYRHICTHIGVSHEWVPQSLTEVVNPARAPRFALFTETVYKVGVVTRALGLGGLVEAAKRWKLLEALLYAPSKSVDIGQHEVARSERERAAGWLNKLEQLIDTRVPVRWRDKVTP
ncbi:sulfotransferase family protein [Qipengyuania gaetbuli]|uniref:sulfotransferase family protein n=1 Tax=Qipengyuania gaetbuli TaxID=266952 RepID=UPI001CD48C4B|nr:sulfotransferase [Qipengyuania gaetbuli]MCA0909396.1 sulfotransferase [Qipengyuania gaetbuli]